MLKVKELIELLKEEDQDAIVLLSSDEEGNSYSPCDSGFAKGNFDEEKGTVVDPRNVIYNMSEKEMTGNYLIIYPY